MRFGQVRFLKLMVFSVPMVFGLSVASSALGAASNSTSKTSDWITPKKSSTKLAQNSAEAVNRAKVPVLKNPTTVGAGPSEEGTEASPVDTKTTSESISDDSRVGYSNGELAMTAASADQAWRRSKETKFAYKLKTGFDSFANEREQAQIYGVEAGADFKAQMSEALAFRIRGKAAISGGYSQSRFGDNVGKSGLFLDEGYVNLRLLNTSFARVYVAGGGFDQGAFESEAFIERQAFPGVRETLVIGSSKAFKVKVWAQQAIPTSKNLSTRTVDAEVTPSMTTETVELSVQPVDAFEAKAAVTHFTFNNLPSAVATESVIYGNSVDEVGPNTSRFKYRFDGMLATAGLGFKFTPRYGVFTEGSMIQNAAAPEGYRNAQLIKAGLQIGLPGEIDIKPWGGMFFVEDDAIPGFYNSSTLGHNNRQGFVATLETFFQRQRFKLKAQFVDADVINYNIYQSRQQTLSIGFETFYEML